MSTQGELGTVARGETPAVRDPPCTARYTLSLLGYTHLSVKLDELVGKRRWQAVVSRVLRALVPVGHSHVRNLKAKGIRTGDVSSAFVPRVTVHETIRNACGAEQPPTLSELASRTTTFNFIHKGAS